GKITPAPDGHDPPGLGSHTRFGKYWTPIPVAAAVGEIVIVPPMSGRSVARPVSEFAFAAGIVPMAPAFPANRVTGFPLCNCVIKENCQPSFNWFPLKGSSYNPLITNRCR